MNITTIDEQAKLTPRQLDWMRRQAIKLPLPTLLVPTLPDRINRLNPQERAEIGRLIKSMKLRKIIRRTLAEAFWARESHEIAAAQADRRYGQALATFEPVITQSQQPTLIEVAR